MPVIQPEGCIGCGAPALRHPMVAVMQDAGQWKAFPVCKACWSEPAHRRLPIKGHFFTRAQEKLAVAMAGSAQIGGAA